MAESSALDVRVAKLGKASQRAALLSLLGFLVVVGALGYASWQLRDLERQKEELWTQIQERKKELATLDADLATLKAWKARLKEANDKLSDTVRAAPPTVAAQPDVRAAENAKYAVGLYGFAVSNEAYERVLSTLRSEGYAITQEQLLPDGKPSWLSPQSVVLYYDKASKEKALSIAAELSKVAGTKFDIATGAGLGVVPGQERWTFFVHYVGE